MPDIYTAIKEDHDKHREMIERIKATQGDSAERRQAWFEFYHEVKSHAAAEEETFYSKLISKTWGQDAARHSVHEHKELDDLMDELNEMDMSSPGWLNKFHTLEHDYLHHIDEEEDEVFGRAKQEIDAAEIEDFGARFLRRKTKERELVDQKLQDHLED